MLLTQGFFAVKIPINGAAAAEDFVLHTEQGTHDQSFHTKALCFHREEEALAHAGDFEFEASIIDGLDEVSIALAEERCHEPVLAELRISKLTSFASDITDRLRPFN